MAVIEMKSPLASHMSTTSLEGLVETSGSSNDPASLLRNITKYFKKWTPVTSREHDIVVLDPCPVDTSQRMLSQSIPACKRTPAKLKFGQQLKNIVISNLGDDETHVINILFSSIQAFAPVPQLLRRFDHAMKPLCKTKQQRALVIHFHRSDPSGKQIKECVCFIQETAASRDAMLTVLSEMRVFNVRQAAVQSLFMGLMGHKKLDRWDVVLLAPCPVTCTERLVNDPVPECVRIPARVHFDGLHKQVVITPTELTELRTITISINRICAVSPAAKLACHFDHAMKALSKSGDEHAMAIQYAASDNDMINGGYSHVCFFCSSLAARETMLCDVKDLRRKYVH